MRPVFEDGLVDALSLEQMRPLIVRDARIEDLVVAAFDDVDRIDLHVAQVLDSEACRLRPIAERGRGIEPLGVQPDASGLGFADRVGLLEPGGHGMGRVQPGQDGRIMIVIGIDEWSSG